MTKTIEYPIKCNGFNLGYIDLLLIFSINKGSRYFTRYFKKGVSGIYTVAFEIKPEVKSIGEVLRQFQYYKSNMSGECKFVLVTKTKGLKELLLRGTTSFSPRVKKSVKERIKDKLSLLPER